VTTALARSASAGRTRAESVVWGALLVRDAARLVFSDPRLARAAAVPTLLTAAACLAAAAWRAWHREAADETALHAFAVAFVAVSSMPPTFLHRMWTRVGIEARRALVAPPAEEARVHGWFRGFAAETVKALRQAVVVAAGLAPVFLVVEWSPFGHQVTTAAALAWAGYWVVLDALEIPVSIAPLRLAGPGAPTWFERGLRRMARARLRFPLNAVTWPFRLFFGLGARWGGMLSRPWRHEVKLTQRYPWETLGFGLAAAAFLLIPGLGLFFRAVVMTGATALLARTGAERRRD